MTKRQKTRPTAARCAAWLATACLLAACHSASASTNNLLINGSFNAGSSGWSTWGWHSESWGSHWANFESPNKLNPLNPAYVPALVGVYDGTMQLTVGANGGGGAGAYQILAATPGVTYTCIVQSGVENWWKPQGEVRLIWLDATGTNEVSRDVVKTACAINADCEPGTNDVYDAGIPYASWTNIATAPVGTKFLKVEVCNSIGTGSVWFDNASLTAPVDPPVIANLYPNGAMLLQATNKLSFTASSAVPINASGIQLVLNGVEVSGSLVVSGSGTTNVNVSYTGLASNRTHTAVITVTDTANLSSFTTVNFDTYAPIFTWEAEDYDYSGGQYLNLPTPSDTPGVNRYFGLVGVEGVDFHDRRGDGDHVYRSGDTMATSLAGEPTRQALVNAGASDHNVGWFDGAAFSESVGIGSYDPGDWLNYTRDFPAGTCNIYGRFANGNGGTATIPLSRVTGGWGSSSQTTTPLGQFQFPAAGWGSYTYVPLTDPLGNKVAIGLSGTSTLRVTAGSGGNLNFFMLVPADTEMPTLTDLYPDGRTLLQGTNVLRFTASSATHSLAQSNIVVTLNGVNVSNSLSFSGSSSSWRVSAPLNLGVTNYTVVISVRDSVGNAHSITRYFDTFPPNSFVVEGEDFDFGGGQFIDNPVITSNAAPNSYFNKESVPGVDAFEGDTVTPSSADFRYRQWDAIATSQCTDTPMLKTLLAQLTNALAFNYNTAWWSSNGWLNFTRTYPTGQFNLYARLAGADGSPYSIRLDKVQGTTNHLGIFAGVGRGYNFFDWIPLMNTNTSQLAEVTLGGVTTLRATTALGDVNPNNFILVPVVPVPEALQWSYAGGVLTLQWTSPAFHLQTQTNAPGSGIGSGWSDYPGGATSPVNMTVDRSKGSIFFRLSN